LCACIRLTPHNTQEHKTKLLSFSVLPLEEAFCIFEFRKQKKMSFLGGTPATEDFLRRPLITMAKQQAIDQYEKIGGSNQYKCKFCVFKCISHTTRMRAHLSDPRFAKANGVNLCPNVSSVISTYWVKHFQDAAISKKKECDKAASKQSSQLHDLAQLAEAISREKKQPLLADCVASAQGMRADEAVARCMYRFALPFHIVDQAAFHDMVEAIKAAPSNWKTPNRKRVAGELLDKTYDKVEAAKKKARSDASHKGKRQTIISDGATIGKHPLTNYLTFVRDYGMMLLGYDDATDHHQEGGKKDANWYADGLRRAIEEVGPTNVIQVVTDCCNVMKAAWRIIEAEYPWIFCCGCLAHQVNTFVKHVCKIPKADEDGDEEDEGWLDIVGDADGLGIVRSMIKKCKRIVAHFNEIHNNRAILRKYSSARLKKDYSFIVPSDTRFGLYLLMLHRVLILKPALMTTCFDEYYQDRDTGVSDIVEDNAFWESLTKFTNFMFPVLRLIRLGDSDMEVIGKVHARVKDITKHFDEHKADEPYFQKIVDLWTTDSKPLVTDLHKVAYALDPEFWDEDHFADNDVMQAFTRAIDKYYSDDSRKAEKCAIVMQQYRQYLSKSHGLDTDVIKMQAATLPTSDFYYMCCAMFPELRAFGMAVSQCLTGAGGCERNWGDYKWIRNKKRNQLSLETIEKLVSVHTEFVVKEKLDEGWRVEMCKWSESDGIVAEDKAIERSRNVVVRKFINYVEDDEADFMKTKNNINEDKIDKKYHHICFIDVVEGEEEIRRVVGAEWHTSTERGRRSQYKVVTQLLGGSAADGFEGYMINDDLHDMIKACPSPHNDCVTLIAK
jgi:hypothetical protein